MIGTDIALITILVTGTVVAILGLVVYFYGPRLLRRRRIYPPAPSPPISKPPILPTSAHARDSGTVPNANTRAFARDHGRRSVILPPPPLAVTRSIDFKGSLVESYTLPPMYMDGSDG